MASRDRMESTKDPNAAALVLDDIKVAGPTRNSHGASNSSDETVSSSGCRQKTGVVSDSRDKASRSETLKDNCEGCQRSRNGKGCGENKTNGHVWYGQTACDVPNTLSTSFPCSPRDDMENYFNANAHMLGGMDAHSNVEENSSPWYNGDGGMDMYESWITKDGEPPVQAKDEGVELFMSEDTESKARTAAYLSQEYLGSGPGYERCNSDDSLFNHCEDDLYQMNVANSVEDIGDFIETDIPKNPYGCGSSDSNSSRSRSLSEEDLPTLALDPSSRVTGAGDIQGALSLDWNLQYNIEHAQRPPNLLVTNRTSALSSDSNGYKPRTVSDTDYGFYTPTSCASGSSLRTRSVQSPQFSDCSVPCGINSADSSAFVSPENENPPVRPRDKTTHHHHHHPGDCGDGSASLSCACVDNQSYTRNEGQAYILPRTRDMENLNLDRISIKSSKEKHIEVKVHNREPEISKKERKRRNKGSGTSGEASSLSGQSKSLPECVHYGHNDLNPRSHSSSQSAQDLPDQFNVSRQTSTSDFDQDENSFQEIVDFPPGLLEMSCPSCEDEEEEDEEDDAAFHPENSSNTPQSQQPSKRSNCSGPDGTDGSLAPVPSGSESLDNLLHSIPVIQIPPADISTEAVNMEDIPLPPQTPILNRQWLKKAAKYLDYNFLYKSLFKDDQSESDSDSDGDLDEADLNFDFEAGHGTELVRDPAHIRGRKMLYSVLLKDALLKHLQDRSNLYSSSDSDNLDIKKVMLWSEYQAYVLQVSQIGTSACGATAVINVLKYFDVYIEQDRVCEVIKTNLRAETASVGEYLLSRSVAGNTAMELIEGIDELTSGAIFGRFFHMFPERDINIRKWLGMWIEKGAVPVVTLNRQRAIPQGWVVPDAWHHQMVYGVGPKGVYLTNPLEIVPEYVIQYQLSSESVLLVRRNDVVSRWHNDCHLGILLQQDDPQWQDMNVLGQVVNVLREERAPRFGTQCPQLTSHITIPAWYKSGVTLFVRRDSPAYDELVGLPDELPIRTQREESSESTSSVGSSLQHLFAEGGGSENTDKDSPS